jgi:two-component system LytT family response regulator
MVAAMLRVAICDDESPALEQLSDMVAQCPELALVGSFESGGALLEAIEACSPDLLLLDLEMPDLDGFAVVEALASVDWTAFPDPPLIIFITADPHFGIVAFDCGLVGILNKPVTPGSLQRGMTRACGAKTRHEARQRLNHLRSQLKEVRKLYRRAIACGHIIIRNRRQQVTMVPLSSVEWIEGHASNHVLLHCGSETYRKYASVTGMTDELACVGFIRIHQSILVNAKAVDHVEFGLGIKKVRVRSGEWLPVSLPYRTAAQVLK